MIKQNAYHARGDTPVSDFLIYSGLLEDGQSLDPAAIYDFLEATKAVVGADNTDD